MNIELKAPLDPQVALKYDNGRFVELVHRLVIDYQVAAYSMIQSFDHNLLR